MVQYCCCYGCKERYVKGGTVTFHSFPKDERRAKIWLQNINRPNFVHSRYSKVCSKHFTEESFDRERFGGVWLKNDAIPTVFDCCERPPKAAAKKRPPKRDNSQNLDELLASIQSRNVPILPAPSTSANSKKHYSIWCISVVPPSAPKPEQTWPDDERNRKITTLLGESNIMPNDSATNKMHLGVATKKESHDRENQDNFLCGSVKQEQEYEHMTVKKEPVEDADESMYSATEEECEHVVVKEEPMEEPDESVNSASEEGCEITIVKEEPADDPDESTYAAAGEVCGRINVKVEQEPEYEGNSCEEHRTQEPEYIEVKSEPLEAEEVTGDGSTHWDSLCFW
ncbi:uncharacterized protein LOC126213448 isoform X7 [Schistocerca nitens]|uniref:uncharacterized protein LOC126213448 isoform X7 n=1 Tax=Schistocerca nitens TaxID=7011 RepID=UPI00211883BF|nr:uncharacterized protein LOC126213448 isoform X7 [Schistocerca nitens]